MARDSFILYTATYEAIQTLTDSQLGCLARALFLYAGGREIPPMDETVTMAFRFIRNQLDAQQKKYAATVEKRKEAANARWKMQKDASAQGALHNDNDNDNDNKNKNKNESVSVTKKENVGSRLTAEERKKIFRKFYLRNFLTPEAEVERYEEWGCASGWRKQSGGEIADRVAYSTFWKPKLEGERFNAYAMKLLRITWKECQAAGDPIGEDIFRIGRVQVAGSHLAIYGRSKSLSALLPYLTRANGFLNGFFDKIEAL